MKILTYFLLIVTVTACVSKKKVLVSTEKQASGLNNIQSNTTIVLDAKTYMLEQPILIDEKRNVTIDGNGATLVMKLKDENVIHISNSENIVLKNFKATHLEPTGPTGCTGNVVYVDYSKSVLIADCELNGCGIVGVAAYNATSLMLRNNFIHKNSEYGVIYQGSSIYLQKNRFANNSKGNIYFSYVPKGEYPSWPPNEIINSNVSKKGIKMLENVFDE